MENEIVCSILTPHYEDVKCLRPTLEKLLPLMPVTWEWIVCDDASVHADVKVFEEMQSKFAQFFFIKNQENMGTVATINRLVKKARGKYIFAVSANDPIYEDIFTEIPSVLAKENVGVVTTVCAEVSKGILQRKVFLNIGNRFDGKALSKLARTSSFWIPGHCSFLRKDLVIKHGLYLKELALFCDWYLNHVIGFDAGMVYCNTALISAYRIQDGSYSEKFSAEQKKDLLKKIVKKINELPKSHRKRIKRSGILLNLYSGAFFDAMKMRAGFNYLPYMIMRKIALLLGR